MKKNKNVQQILALYCNHSFRSARNYINDLPTSIHSIFLKSYKKDIFFSFVNYSHILRFIELKRNKEFIKFITDMQ